MAKTFSFEEALPSAGSAAPATFSFEDAFKPTTPVAEPEPIFTPEERMAGDPALAQPSSSGITAISDISKLFGAGAVKGIAGAPEAVQQAATVTSRETATKPSEILNLFADPRLAANKMVETFGFNPIFEIEKPVSIVPNDLVKRQSAALDETFTKGKIPALTALTNYGSKVSKELEESVSPEMKEAMASTEPTGNLVKAFGSGDFSQISFGKDPSAQGLIGQAAKVFGSSGTALALGLLTRSPTVGGAAGFGMAGSEGVDTAKEYIEKMSDQELNQNSEYFRNLVVMGYDKKTAREMTIDKASSTAAFTQGLVGALGGQFTTKLVTGQFNKPLIEAARQRLGAIAENRAARIAGGVAIGAAEEGLQELAEGIATDLSIDRSVVREIGVDSFANLVLGAIGGSGPGAVSGAMAKEPLEQAPTGEVTAPIAPAPFTFEEASTPTVAPVEATAPRAAPASESQDTQAMLDEFRNMGIPSAEPEPMAAAEPTPPAEIEAVPVPEIAPPTAPAEPEAAQPAAVKPTFQEKFEQNKAIETELKDLYRERNKLSRIGDNLIPFLKKYGVNPNAKADMGIEKGDRRLPVGVFKKSGYGLDELARAAVNDGIITEQDLARQPDEVEAFRELVYDALQGNVSQTPFNLENMAKLNAIESRIEQLERPEQPASFDLQAETAQETEARLAQEAEQKKLEDDKFIQDEMAAQAERDRAEIARQSVQQAKNFTLGQTPQESLTGQERLDDDIPFARSKVASPEEMDLAEKVANVYRDDGRDSNVVYQKGDIALIQTRKKNGDVIYMPIKGQRHSTNYVDVSTDKGSQLMTALNLTQAQKDDLVKAREEIELSEKEKHEKTPFLVIKPGVTGSPGIPKEFVNVARGFVKMLGITGNIYIISKAEAAANKDKFTGPHRPIGYMGDKVEFGSVRKLDDDNFVMLVNPGTSKVRTIETIAHELGHIHEIQVFDNASPEVQKAIIKDFNKWFDSQKNMSAKELVDTLRPKVTAQQTEIVNPMARATDLDAYWRNFPEWYADQVSRWATTSDKPLTVVDKFFKKLADALKKFYTTLKGQKYLPAQSMKEFLDNIAVQSQFESIKENFDKGQMALFSKSKVESTKKQDADDITESKGKVEAPTTAEEKPTATARNYLGKQIQANWAFPEDNVKHWPGLSDQAVDNFLYKIQDKQIDTKRTQEAIEKAAGEIEENINVYEKEQLYHGRTATGIRKFLLDELMPTIKELGALKLTPQDLKDYLYNRHAEERNDKMNEVNKLDPITGKERKSPWELQDRASGISTKDARAYLANLEPAQKAALEKVAKRIDEMVQGTQQILLASGAEDKATIDAYNNTYKHYVPLFRIEDDFTKAGGIGATGSSKGFGVRGAFSKRAMGSEKEVQDILGNLIAQRERALIRAEKSKVGQALYGLALTNPNPDLWLPVNPDAIKSRDALVGELQDLGYKDAAQIADNLMEEPKSRYISKETKQYVDPDTGLPMQVTEESVKLKIDNLKRFGDNVFPVRINGKDRYIFFNKNDPRALRMVHSLMNLDADSLGDIEGIIAKATRWFASVNTQYNPVFGVVNLIRDVGGATLNLSTTAIAGDQAKVNRNVIPAMRGILNVLRDERKGKTDTNGKWAKAFQDFREQGGQTGYRDSLIRTDEEKQIVEREINKMKSGNTKKAFFAVVGALSDFNDMMENSIRVSAYMAALDKGLSKQKAAILAKNLTVNFDKKGQLSARINAYFAFFNASVQGTARLAKTLKGPKGKAIIGGGIALGAAQAVILALAGYDDDNPPEFIRERNFVVPLPNGDFLTIPYPLGFNVLPNVGRLTTEFVLSGGKDPGKKVTALLGSVVDAFSPVGGSELSLQTIAPTVLDPAVALATNKDAFGRPIYKKDQATNPTPGYLRSRENASEISKNIAYFLNLASGGTKYSKGYVSPTGDEIDYLVGQITGGVGRELQKAEQTVKAGVTGEELPAYRIPLVGRFYGETQSNAAESQRFYDNIIKMADYENEVKGRIKNKEPVGEYLRDNPQARFWRSANNVENQINQLNKQKKEFIEQGLPRERIKRIENQKAAIMKRFNDQIAQSEE